MKEPQTELRHEVWIIASFGWLESAHRFVLDAEDRARQVYRETRGGPVYVRSYGCRDVTVTRFGRMTRDHPDGWERVRTLRKRSGRAPMVTV